MPASRSISATFATKRPKEQVLHFLQEQFREGNVAAGDRLPTTRAIATRLGVSASTVRAVFRQLAEEGTIRTQVGNGSFLVRSPTVVQSDTLRIGLTFGFGEAPKKSEPWHYSIATAVLSAASARSEQIAIIPLQFRPGGEANARRFLDESMAKVDGIILRASWEWRVAEEQWLQGSKMPIVHLNPVALNATTNFVSVDFFEVGTRVGAGFAAADRKQVVFLHAHPPELSTASCQVLAGMMASLGNRLGHETGFRIELAAQNSRSEGFAAAERLFAGECPESAGVFAVSDDLAEGVVDYCEQHNIEVPRRVSVVAGSGIGQFSSRVELTRERDPSEQIAGQLLDMLIARIQQNGTSCPAVYLPANFIGGGTTLPVENAALGV